MHTRTAIHTHTKINKIIKLWVNKLNIEFAINCDWVQILFPHKSFYYVHQGQTWGKLRIDTLPCKAFGWSFSPSTEVSSQSLFC